MGLASTLDAGFEQPEYESFPAPSVRMENGRLILPAEVLTALAKRAFGDIAFFARSSHLKAIAAIMNDSTSTENDRWVARELLRNAAVAARGEFALCQDTGTAIVMGWKSESVATGADDSAAFEAGISTAYRERHLRASQIASTSLYDEFNTADNLPAQIHLEAEPDGEQGPHYRLLFIAKGGGSANKTALFPMTKALLEPEALEAFLREKVASLGVAACPPYHIAVVIGGTSAEENLRISKLATTELLDRAPEFTPGECRETARSRGWIRRDKAAEELVLKLARESGLGAQFGGTGLAVSARVLRLTRHAASCPVSIAVSCSAHRNMLAIIDRNGVRIEKLCHHPERFLAASAEGSDGEEIPSIDLDAGMDGVRAALSGFAVGQRVRISGSLIVARDAAHLKWHELLAEGKELPGYLRKYPVFYAGPAGTPPGRIIGSMGPTTAGRMDPYADELMSRGYSLVTVAKGGRSPEWTNACKTYGGFYLGAVGGAAALIAEDHITENELLDYAELGMEAVRRIRVKDLPVFILTDDKGNELYSSLT